MTTCNMPLSNNNAIGQNNMWLTHNTAVWQDENMLHTNTAQHICIRTCNIPGSHNPAVWSICNIPQSKDNAIGQKQYKNISQYNYITTQQYDNRWYTTISQHTCMTTCNIQRTHSTDVWQHVVCAPLSQNTTVWHLVINL